MPRQKDASEKQEFCCSFTLPKDVYQQFRRMSADTCIGMRELYRRACEDYAKQQMQQQTK